MGDTREAACMCQTVGLRRSAAYLLAGNRYSVCFPNLYLGVIERGCRMSTVHNVALARLIKVIQCLQR